MNTTRDEYTFIAERLAAREKLDTIAHALLMRRALEEVELVARDLAAREQDQQLRREYEYYIFLGPLPKPLKIRDEGGLELWQQQGRQQYRVKVKDLPAFCKEMKLDEKAMREVAEGKRRDHKDWIIEYTGNHFDAGHPYFPPARTSPPQSQSRTRRKSDALRADSEEEMASLPYLPAASSDSALNAVWGHIVCLSIPLSIPPSVPCAPLRASWHAAC